MLVFSVQRRHGQNLGFHSTPEENLGFQEAYCINSKTQNFFFQNMSLIMLTSLLDNA